MEDPSSQIVATVCIVIYLLTLLNAFSQPLKWRWCLNRSQVEQKAEEETKTLHSFVKRCQNPNRTSTIPSRYHLDHDLVRGKNWQIHLDKIASWMKQLMPLQVPLFGILDPHLYCFW